MDGEITQIVHDALLDALAERSSPTIGRGGVHGGQRGYIVYEPAVGAIVEIIAAAVAEKLPQNVVPFRPATADLSNTPHMMRLLAEAVERGEHGPEQTAIVVLPQEKGPPLCFGFGSDDAVRNDRVIGVLECAKNFMVQRVFEENTDAR